MIDLDDVAARYRRGNAITLDEYRALAASGRTSSPYRSIGRGSSRRRKWDAQQQWSGRPGR